MRENNVNSVFRDLIFHICLDFCRGLLIRKPQQIVFQSVVFVYAISATDDQMPGSFHSEDVSVPGEE